MVDGADECSDDGDLTLSGQLRGLPLARFSANGNVDAAREAVGGPDVMAVATKEVLRMEPGWPGTMGVIGRRVSVLDAGGRVVGDGVVGWNQ